MVQQQHEDVVVVRLKHVVIANVIITIIFSLLTITINMMIGTIITVQHIRPPWARGAE